ncbi:MAG: hypothetical protein ACI9UV_000185 [Algoriphagus sp.]|jgi:hypothetical protein
MVFWMFVHVLLGFVSLISPFPLIGWFYLSLFSSFIVVLRPNTPPSVYTSFMVYMISFEIIARMAQTSPYIPYEMGKYLFFILLVIGIIKYKTASWPPFIMVLCLLPAVLFDLSGQVSFLDMIFNFLGPLNVALAMLFFHGKRTSLKMLLETFKLLLYPMVSVLAFVLFKVPDLAEVDFSLTANSITSGGFGSNQVSTGLGLAAFIVFIFWINKWKLTGFRILDTGLLVFFTLQGLLTFSRGGMVTGFLGIFLILFFLRSATSQQVKRFGIVRIGKYLIPAFLVIMGTFFLVNRLTDGMLLLRYQGETQGTMAGTKQKSLNSITSGRFDILMGDLELWLDHPVFGVGAGTSRYLRERMNGVVAHVELSRLLAEHGLLGIIYFIILMYYGFKIIRSHPNPAVLGILIALFAVGVFTSFHAAMRTFVSPLMIGLSMLTIKDARGAKLTEAKDVSVQLVNQTPIKI